MESAGLKHAFCTSQWVPSRYFVVHSLSPRHPAMRAAMLEFSTRHLHLVPIHLIRVLQSTGSCMRLVELRFLRALELFLLVLAV